MDLVSQSMNSLVLLEQVSVPLRNLSLESSLADSSLCFDVRCDLLAILRGKTVPS
jgi:hypothetical protein